MATRHYTPRKAVETEELQGPVAPEVVMPHSGSFTREEVPAVEVVADVGMVGKDWAANMRFLEEPVTIRLHDTTDPNVEPRVPVNVNGERAHPKWGNDLPRGIELVVKRKVAGAIARAKPIRVRTIKTQDGDGNDTARIERTIGSKYPFELVNPSPRDIAWLKQVRAEA